MEKEKNLSKFVLTAMYPLSFPKLYQYFCILNPLKKIPSIKKSFLYTRELVFYTTIGCRKEENCNITININHSKQINRVRDKKCELMRRWSTRFRNFYFIYVYIYLYTLQSRKMKYFSFKYVVLLSCWGSFNILNRNLR